VTRVLHVPAIGWQPTEGIARSCRALAVELAAAYGVQSDLVANRDTAPYDSAFANTRVIRGWTPATP